MVADPVCEGWRWAQQQFCTAGTSCHLQPFGSPASTLWTSKLNVPLWKKNYIKNQMLFFNKAECFEDIQTALCCFAPHVVSAGFVWWKIWMCVLERGGDTERLSWISWVTALPLLHAWPRIKKTKTLNRRHCAGEIYIHAYLHVFCTLQLIYSRELWAELWGVGLRERLCNSMYTMPLFHICSSAWMWLLCIKGCFTRVKLVGWGCGRF